MIEVGGKMYRERPKKSTSGGRRMGKLYAISAMMGAPMGMPSKKKRPNVNIVEEYRLVLQKKSKLSSNHRDWVEAMFHNQYEEIPQEDL